MTHDHNYYVIVGRDGSRAVARWSPVEIDAPATARNGEPCQCQTKPGLFAQVELLRGELKDDAV